MADGEFSVFVFERNGRSRAIERWIDARTATFMAAALTAAIEHGMGEDAVRVIITDGGDCTVFEWRCGEGVTWPPPARSAG